MQGIADQNKFGSHRISTALEVVSTCSSWICESQTDLALEELDLFHNFYFPEYFQSISRIFLYHGKHFHIMNLEKNTMEIGFSNLFLQFFQKISVLWKRSIPVLFKTFIAGDGSVTQLMFRAKIIYSYLAKWNYASWVMCFFEVRRKLTNQWC